MLRREKNIRGRIVASSCHRVGHWISFGIRRVLGRALWVITGRITVWKGIGLGVFLWLIMQLVVFPFLGWGAFAAGMNPKIAAAALVEHLVFGTVMGWLGTRGMVPVGDLGAR